MESRESAQEALNRGGVVLAVSVSITLLAAWLCAPGPGWDALAAGWTLAAFAGAAQVRRDAMSEYAFLAFLFSAITGPVLVAGGGENAALFQSISAMIAMAGLLVAPVPQHRALRALAVFATLSAAVFLAGFARVSIDSVEGALVLSFSVVALGGLQLRALRERRAQHRLRELERLAMLDPLTGLLNRRSAFVRLDSAIQQHAEAGRPFALAMIDLDGFKSVNDTFGHDAGDRVLMEVAALLRSPRDGAPPLVAARLGGDEFVAGWAGVGEAQAWKLAGKLRTRVQAIRLDEAPDVPLVDVSVGVVVRRPGGTTEALDALLRRADKLMYDIKRRRRLENVQAA